jgi:spore cortex formation protein SpoVR/YcgB (stage V sporulation)
LKGVLKDDKPLKKNSPTSPAFKVRQIAGDVPTEKRKWVELIDAYAAFNDNEFVHWFFGKMTREQVGYFAYKHSDHHLRQFGC